MDGFSYGIGGGFYVGGGCGIDISYSQNDEGYLDVTEVTVRSGVGEGIMVDIFASYI